MRHQIEQQALRLHDCEPATNFEAEVLAGLRKLRKALPCKLFYDDMGSALFDRICQLKEYYQTRTELSIMRRHINEMGQVLGEGCVLIEYGSGSSLKTRVLLDHLRRPVAYVPIDISRKHLMRTSLVLAAKYPHVAVMPVCADYTASFTLPELNGHASHRVVYFPGSTIGNFEPGEARQFLGRIRKQVGRDGGLLIGVDLKKSPRLLHAAYNDSAGVTAAFNLNLLARINRELNGTFDLSAFDHYAFYNPRQGRVEMHLVSLVDQPVRVAGESFHFMTGESIFTESAYKYTVDEFALLAGGCGFRLERTWTDDRRLFSVLYMSAR